MVISPFRLTASQSFIKGYGRYACRRGGTFVPTRRAQPALQSGRPSAMLRAALFAAVRPPLPTRSRDLAGTPNSKTGLGQAPRPPRSSDATSALIGQTLRCTAGTPLRCGASSSPPKRGRGFLSRLLLILIQRSAWGKVAAHALIHTLS